MNKSINCSLKASNHIFRPHMIFVWVMLIMSFLPFFLVLTNLLIYSSGYNFKGTVLDNIANWYSSKVSKVEEMRKLTSFPNEWSGPWYSLDKNYSQFDKWFNDNLGLRDFFIRSKNELDYSLFRSSSRVYYGADNYIYGRHLIDNELPATEKIMSSNDDISLIIKGMERFSNELSGGGITTYFVMPMQKEYFIKNRLPFFAPKISKNSNFMQFYHQVMSDKKINSIDVYSLINSIPHQYRTFYTQDFHWTTISSFFISRDIVNNISKRENSALRWNNNLDVIDRPFLGSDARFASRLVSNDYVVEPEVKKTWVDIHKINDLKGLQAGFEFDTDTISDRNLLPKTCMFGNSFSDGMLDVGIINYFTKFIKLDRTISVSNIPSLISGKCNYLIVQILDIQPNIWLSFKSLGKE